MVQPNKPAFLEFMPVSIFGAVMGLTGLCFAWRLAERALHKGNNISIFIGWMAILVFIVLAVAYVIKWARYPKTVAAEFNSPVSISFFSTIVISILLIPGILLPYAPVIAKAMWLAGVFLIFLLAWFVLRKWTGQQQVFESAVPAWVLPVTGTLNVAIVGSAFHFAGARELCLLGFGFGVIFIMMLMTIIIWRLFFQSQLPAGVQPSLLILAAPFALAFSGYEGISGQQDIMASALFYFTICMLLLFGSKIMLLPKCCPFNVSWWSVSFPLAANTIACFHYWQGQPNVVYWTLATVLLVVTTLVIGFLLVQTITQIWNGSWKP